MNYVWCCTCGENTPCNEADQKVGATWYCDNCNTFFGCVLSSKGPKVWLSLDTQECAFHNILKRK